jgi:thiamine pyrophosphokinase
MKTNDTKKSVLIIANGEPPGDNLLQKLVDQSDIIIAADGGSNICFRKNIYPDFIIGDFDSIEPHVLSHFKDCEIIRRTDQSTHDLFKAIDFSKTLNPHIIRIVAAFGKRLDHSMANLLLLQQMYEGLSLEFYDSHGRLSMLSGNQKIEMPVGQIISLFSFLPVQGITLDGFKYSLKDKDYPDGFNGLSNIAERENVRIRIKRGSLYLYITNENIKS